MQPLEIITCTRQDAAALTELSRKTFYESFAAQNSPQDIAQYLQAAFTVEKISSELNNVHSAFYFAKLNNSTVGYMKLNFSSAQTELQDEQALEIERIYVSKEHASQGIGQQLMNKAIAIAKESGLVYIWLGVWEKNDRAIRFYERQGFRQFDSHKFTLGQDIQTDLLMKKIIS